MSSFVKELEQAINRHSKEAGSSTPDFVLAEFLTDILAAYDKAVKSRGAFFGASSLSPAVRAEQDAENLRASSLAEASALHPNQVAIKDGFICDNHRLAPGCGDAGSATNPIRTHEPGEPCNATCHHGANRAYSVADMRPKLWGRTRRDDLDPEEEAELINLFSYHGPSGDQPTRYARIREAGKVLAREILLSTPKSADQSAAIRKVREAVMTANAAIALE